MPQNSVTIKIGSDTKEFERGLKKVDREIVSTQRSATNLQKTLNYKYDEKFVVQAQKQLRKALDLTEEKAKALREELKYLEGQGKIDSEAYSKFQLELSKTEAKAVELRQKLNELNTIRLDRLEKNLKNVGDGITRVGQKMSVFSAGAATALTALGSLAIKAGSTGAEIDDLSLRFGVSAETIQEWQYLAVQCGVDIEVFNKALIRARAAMLDLSTGKTNEAAKTIQALGISMDQYGSNEEMFDGIIDALAAVEDKTLQAAYANEIFGDKIANQMLPFINTGSEAIAQFREEFAAMNNLTNEQVAELATLDDTIYRLKESLKYAALQIGAALMPVVKSLTQYVQEHVVPLIERIARWFEQLSEQQQATILKILAIIAALGPLLIIIGKLTAGVGGLISMSEGLSKVLSVLSAHPIIAIIGAVIGLLTLLYTTNEDFRKSINGLISTLGKVLSPVLTLLAGLLKTIFNVLSPILEILGGILASIINSLVAKLSPLLELIGTIFELLAPFLELILIPLQLVLEGLKIPLQIIGSLLGWLAPLFEIFGSIVSDVLNGITTAVNLVLGTIEDAINWVIDQLNKVIDVVNAAGGIFGFRINKIEEVSLRIKREAETKKTEPNLNSSAGLAANGDFSTYTNSSQYVDYSDHSNNEYNITIESNEYMNEEQLVDAVSRKMATAVQTRR